MPHPSPPHAEYTAAMERLRAGANARDVARDCDLPLALVAEWAAELRAQGQRQ